MSFRSKHAGAPGLAFLLALLLAACGTADNSGNTGTTATPDYSKAIDRAPPKLAKLYGSGDEVSQSGQDAFDSQIAALRGYPIVVNNWASWCLPCREEFPLLQSQAARHLDEVAFLGVDSQDSVDAASTFLSDHAVPYPSIGDPDGDFPNWVDKTLVGIPNTLFYNRSGDLVYVKQGPYTDEAALAADIKQFALAS